MTASIMFWAFFVALFKEHSLDIIKFGVILGIIIVFVQGFKEGLENRKRKKALRAMDDISHDIDKAIEQIDNIKLNVSCTATQPTRRLPQTSPSADEANPNDIDIQELSIPQLQKRLNALYNRRDRLEYINGTTPESWKKFQGTKTYRGLEWDIQDTEERLERAINKEKERWARA